MKIKHWLITLIVLLIALSTVFGQESYGIINYGISFPTGNTKDYINNTSFRGFGFEFGKYVTPNLALGLSFNWHVFYERNSERISLENADISGVQDRYINNFPLMVSARYIFAHNAPIHPYIGLNVGIYRFLQTMNIGIYTFEAGTWQFGLAPKIGIFVPIGHDTMFMLSGTYQWVQGVKTIGGGKDDFPYITLKMGFVYSLGWY